MALRTWPAMGWTIRVAHRAVCVLEPVTEEACTAGCRRLVIVLAHITSMPKAAFDSDGERLRSDEIIHKHSLAWTLR